MLLIVGLGNPGKEYEKTRHNAGWLFLDYLKSLPESDFEEWREKKKLNSLMSEGFFSMSLRGLAKQSHFARLNEIATSATEAVGTRDDSRARIILAKPLTFMNDSGSAVQKLTNHYSLTTSHLIIAHDDIDIPFGEFKIQTNRGPAGHHGVESIIEHLGTKDFARVRIGIAPEHRSKAMDHVLKKFSKDELTELSTLFSRIVQSLTKQNVI